MTRVRFGLNNITSNMGKNNFSTGNNSNSKTGKVYGIVTTENTPTKKQFERVGGFAGIGTIFYLDFNQSIEVSGSNLDEFLNTCAPALPLTPLTYIPTIGETVLLYQGLPSMASEDSPNSFQTYYGETINIFNDIQQNSFSNNNLNKTFVENSDIRNLLKFEGDRIYQGRKGNGIRFGSTVKSKSDINEWSSIGNNGDPITIMVNGYVTTDTGSSVPNVEEINKEQSSIYLTSTQKLPLYPGASIVNPRVNTILPKDYNSSQLIFNSDRITLNSKKDEVLLFAKTNIELNSDNIININAGIAAHINSPSINLGTKTDGSYPTEAVLLGNQTIIAFDKIVSTLQNLAYYLSLAATKDGPIVACNSAGTQLFADLDGICDQLDKCLSTKVYTI
jgi:hypothetical protein